MFKKIGADNMGTGDVDEIPIVDAGGVAKIKIKNSFLRFGVAFLEEIIKTSEGDGTVFVVGTLKEMIEIS